MFFSPSFASSFSSCFFVLSFFFPVLSCFLLLLHVFLLYLLACLYFGVSMNHRRLYRCSATPALLYGFHGLATIASSGRRHSYGHFLSLSGPLPTPAAPATISLIRPFQPLSGRYGCSPTIPAIVCLFQPLRSLFGWRSGRSLAAPLFIVRPSPWSFVFVRSCPPAPSPCVAARPCLPAFFFHLYVCCRLSSLPLFGRFFFLVICPVLSGRPLAVRPTLHPEASIGHSANYWSLFGAPFRPLVRSLVFSRLHLREFQPPPSLAISAGCRSGHSRSVVGCLAAPVVVRLFRSLLYGCCTADATIWQPLHTARPIGWPFLPLRLYFGHFCHSSEAVRPLQPSSFLTVRLRLRRPSSFGPFRAVVRFIGCLYFFISVRCYPSLLGHSSGCLCAFGSNCLPLARSFVCCAV